MNTEKDILSNSSDKIHTDDEILLKFEEICKWHAKNETYLVGDNADFVSSMKLYWLKIYSVFSESGNFRKFLGVDINSFLKKNNNQIEDL